MTTTLARSELRRSVDTGMTTAEAAVGTLAAGAQHTSQSRLWRGASSAGGFSRPGTWVGFAAGDVSGMSERSPSICQELRATGRPAQPRGGQYFHGATDLVPGGPGRARFTICLPCNPGAPKCGPNPGTPRTRAVHAWGHERLSLVGGHSTVGAPCAVRRAPCAVRGSERAGRSWRTSCGSVPASG